jgi:phage terminase small subunit
LLAKVSVAALVTRRRRELSEKTGLTAAWVLEGLRENKERAMQAEPVLDREGNPTGEYVYQGSVANRALELIGKQLGMFVDRVEVQGGLRILVVDESRRA